MMPKKKTIASSEDMTREQFVEAMKKIISLAEQNQAEVVSELKELTDDSNVIILLNEAQNCWGNIPVCSLEVIARANVKHYLVERTQKHEKLYSY